MYKRCETIAQVRELQERRDDRPYAPDWIVQVIVDHGANQPGYRWQVCGINANVEPGGYGRAFYWRVPYLSWRYDLSAARLLATAAEAAAYTVIDPVT